MKSSPPPVRRVAIGLVIGVIVAGIVAGGAGARAGSAVPSPPTQLVLPSHAAATTPSYCGLLGPDPGAVNIPGPNYTAIVTVLWEKLCVETAFVQLIDEWGGLQLVLSANNTTYVWVADNLTAGGSFNATGFTSADWTVDWVAACVDPSDAPDGGPCEHAAYWTGNLSSEALYGPACAEYEAFSTGPIPHDPSVACPGAEASGTGLAPRDFPGGWIVAVGLAVGSAAMAVILARRARRS